MYARSTTIQAQPALIDAGIAHFRDVTWPILQGIDGCLGMSVLVNRGSGRCILTNSWQTKEAMHASAEQVRLENKRAADMLGGSPIDNLWQIAVVRRDDSKGPGACVRAAWLKARPELFESAIDFYRQKMLPAIEGFDGFCSASLMVDPTAARAVASVTFDSVGSMERSADATGALQTAMLRDLDLDQDDVGEFELALAHLRVPRQD
ncbi:hypothetical protein A5791_16570 [Mycobacterium sp. 852002-51163_SCH5372311]|uniref:hypothetical protein n=1 Tax=Mycobacterium sp. 852002-51163_SCH5372311 TaxID=1834097 RepID=UPI0007FC8FC4|nr:hypothetical protein [Mycobacterium sp. 852002-51163_SCH5372311]OBF90061.1 hypothetical protein A5791_16570 [Mycobacterium sp. 852002-51163_SCH5372311]